MPSPHITVELPQQGTAAISAATRTEASVSRAVVGRIALELGAIRVTLTDESWATIIPVIVAMLDDKWRDDAANTICAGAGQVTA